MSKTKIPARIVEDVVHLACRAPSYHNTQPWRWIADREGLQLFVDTDRVEYLDKA